jgi:L-arabinose isomerase
MPKLVTTLDHYEVWFLTGSQNLYGEETLRQVAEQSGEIARALDAAGDIPVRIVWKPVLKDSESIRRAALDANSDDNVIGLIAWMHTFSPAKMWIAGLDALRKPLLHLHTQANVELPWSEIDFDFMNLNQAAHGDREFGYIQSRLGVARKTVVGHVSDERVTSQIGTWSRAAAGWAATHELKLARFGDNMRYVAVTEGDKTEAELRFGVQVNTWGVNELVAAVDAASDAEVDAPRSKSGCAPSSRPADSAPSRRVSRTSVVFANSPAWPCSGSWPRGTASARRATGRPRCSCVRQRSWAQACQAAPPSWRTTHTTSRRATR